MTNTHDELMPCPFCGETAIHLHSNEDRRFFWAECSKCDVEARGASSEGDARKQWNQRSALPQDDELERLRGALEPFARWADSLDRTQSPLRPLDGLVVVSSYASALITVGDFREARSALSHPRPNPTGEK